MIELTNLNGVPFILNDHLIETIENIPETKITLTTGKYILVTEDKAQIIDRVIAYNQQIFSRKIFAEYKD
jgi:flagellar protein FlbD